ncbi:hypothetical protein [Streptomyces sp. NPDC003032]
MSDVQPVVSGVQADYAARVAADLETNRREQQRIGAEVAALQEQLRALESDCAVLLSVQEALGSSDPSAGVTKKASSRKRQVPAPRAGARKSGAARTESAPATGTKEKAAKKPSKAAAEKPAVPAGPTLVELISGHLGKQGEPRSAAEITSALAQAHPDRNIKATVVRTTVEGLVAKGRAERTKQGSSVFYTAAVPAESPAVQEPETSTS